MNGDQVLRKRVHGKQSTAQRLIWQLDTGPLRIRCLITPDGDAYRIQARSPNGWKDIGGGDDPTNLLKTVVGSSSVVEMVVKTAALAEVSR